MSKSRASKMNGYRSMVSRQKNDVFKFKPKGKGDCMAKAVLVMDMPEQVCQKCTLCYETENDDEYLCCAAGKLLPDGEKPDWCPLRELPERKETHTVLELHSNGRWTEGMKAGFNACLDEILRKGQGD